MSIPPRGPLSRAAVWPAAVLLVAAAWPSCSWGQIRCFISLQRTNERLQGRVLEFTRHHGSDNRLWSSILQQRRDVYVYLPPGYRRDERYSLMLWLHGAFGDEHSFLETAQLQHLDEMILRGSCPPMIVVAPDLTCRGKNFVTAKHSFAVNGVCGRFEDHLMREIVPWACARYAVDRDRRRHIVTGVSAGGLGAMQLALKNRDFFGMVVSVSGALNLRYYNSQRQYLADFDPRTFIMRSSWNREEVIGKLGPLNLKAKTFIEPVFGADSKLVQRVVRCNPADLLESTDLQPGELAIRVTYGGKDNLNFDAHGASFAWLARRRGVAVDVERDPEGEHSFEYLAQAQRRSHHWVARRLRETHVAPVVRVAAIGE